MSAASDAQYPMRRELPTPKMSRLCTCKLDRNIVFEVQVLGTPAGLAGFHLARLDGTV